MPTKIVFGENSLKQIDEFTMGRRTLLVTSAGFVKRGVVKQIQSYTSNIVAVVSEVQSHPDISDIKELYAEAYKHDFDIVVALGGGSVLDVSKFLAVAHSTDKTGVMVEKLMHKKENIENFNIKPIISIPTTAGTSSEVTPWATIWDNQDKRKYSLHLPELFSEVALYDPILTLSLPREITVQTTLDALSHSLESIWNKNASEITIAYAVKAAQKIVKNLPLLLNDLNNVQYRTEILKACMYAGMAFSNTQTAVAHAMSYSITLNHGIPHGIACSFTLPMLLKAVMGVDKRVDKALKSIFGEQAEVESVNFFKKVDVSIDFKDYNMQKADFDVVLGNLSREQRLQNSIVPLENIKY